MNEFATRGPYKTQLSRMQTKLNELLNKAATADSPRSHTNTRSLIIVTHVTYTCHNDYIHLVLLTVTTCLAINHNTIHSYQLHNRQCPAHRGFIAAVTLHPPFCQPCRGLSHQSGCAIGRQHSHWTSHYGRQPGNHTAAGPDSTCSWAARWDLVITSTSIASPPSLSNPGSLPTPFSSSTSCGTSVRPCNTVLIQ